MNPNKNKKLILSLIKDDLINTKLVNGLDALGLNAQDYLLHLSDTVFNLMKIKDDENGEKLFEHYLNLKDNVRFIESAKSHESFDDLALAIYIDLVNKKLNQ
ncbi:MAG: hypothetical protein JNM51_06335 [Bacteroidia bacterium]|nr:hypothetical protein [Bacteroidia bacterium]